MNKLSLRNCAGMAEIVAKSAGSRPSAFEFCVNRPSKIDQHRDARLGPGFVDGRDDLHGFYACTAR